LFQKDVGTEFPSFFPASRGMPADAAPDGRP
jgi:hypothetical protein